MNIRYLDDILLRCIRALPAPLRRVLFLGGFRLFQLLVPRQRLIASHNLRRAFPEKAEREIRRIVRGVYQNAAIVAAEFFDIPRLTRERIAKQTDIEGLEHCEAALAKGRGLLIFGAHFGNWELSAATMALLVKPMVVIYRRLDSPLLERLVLRIRSATGNTPLLKDRAMRPMLRALRQNGIVGILIDQNVDWYEGVFVEYFGRPACTTDGLALLALHTGAPVIPAFMVRLPDGRYRLVFGPEVELVRSEDPDADARNNTQRFTRILEEIVRRYPDQWLWIHQRWKTQPCQDPRRERC